MCTGSNDFEQWLSQYREVRALVAKRIDEETIVPLVRRLAWKLAFALDRVSAGDIDPALDDFELSVLQRVIQEMNAFIECTYGGSTFGTMSAARAMLETAALAQYVLDEPEKHAERLADYQQSGDGRSWHREKILDLMNSLDPGEASVTAYKATSKAVHLSAVSKRLTCGITWFHYDEERRYAREAAFIAKATNTILGLLPGRGTALFDQVADELVALATGLRECQEQLETTGKITFRVPEHLTTA